MMHDSTDHDHQRPSWLSPSLSAMRDGSGVAAYELKFGVSEPQAKELEAWAKGHLQLDPHADGENGYQITSIYFDTPTFDVFRKQPGYDVNKYRLRRYGLTPTVHLERKSKQDGRIWKCRESMDMSELARPRQEWPVNWFTQELDQLQLQPTGVSKFRRCLRAAGLIATEGTNDV